MKCDICGEEAYYYGPQHCVFYCNKRSCQKIASEIINSLASIHEDTNDD